MQILKAKLDIIFKKLFADPDNSDLLQDFLSSMLGIPYNDIKDIVVENPEIYPEDIEGKFCRLDLRLTVGSRLINVEMQSVNEGNFAERSLFYWAKLYTSGLESGQDYGRLKETLSINVLNFNLFGCSEYHSLFELREHDRGELLTDKLAIHFFELRKINRRPDRTDRRQVWLNFINAENEEELTMITDMNIPVMNKAVTVLREMSEDDRMREKAAIREKRLHDEVNALTFAEQKGIAIGKEEGIAIGTEKGIAIGKEEGRAEGISMLVESMRKKGISDEMIEDILKNAGANE